MFSYYYFHSTPIWIIQTSQAGLLEGPEIYSQPHVLLEVLYLFIYLLFGLSFLLS